MKILLIGDIVGKPGRRAVSELVPRLKKEEGITCVIGNGENAAGGSGITPEIADDLFKSGIDCITSGDHIWKRSQIYERLREDTRILRPANFPEGTPGQGSTVINVSNAGPIGVINLTGRVFMPYHFDCPFKTADREIERLLPSTRVIIVDIHAEATSEKIALGWYLDGRVTAVFGTHTHIQTADERILPSGTAYITDLGMVGPYDSVLGRRYDQIINRFLTQMPTKFELAEDNIQLHGAILEVDTKTGKALSIERVQKKL